jgi:phage-related protein
MSIELYVQGEKADIYVYVDSGGQQLAADFIDQLDESDQKKVLQLLRRFAQKGEIHNREKFRLEEKPIYAFKSFQIRILCFFLPDAAKRTIVLTHGLKKKQDKLSRSELDKANRIYNECI